MCAGAVSQEAQRCAAVCAHAQALPTNACSVPRSAAVGPVLEGNTQIRCATDSTSPFFPGQARCLLSHLPRQGLEAEGVQHNGRTFHQVGPRGGHQQGACWAPNPLAGSGQAWPAQGVRGGPRTPRVAL